VIRRPLILAEVEHAIVFVALNAYAEQLRRVRSMDASSVNAEIDAALEVLEGGTGAGRETGLIGRLSPPPFDILERIEGAWRDRADTSEQPAAPAGA
jgi:hypothetical protein